MATHKGEGDFHAALNFASTLKVPVVFICRNNGYAISTKSSQQFNADGVVSRATGYGVHAIRVDGNDVLAMHMATSQAKKHALENNCPVLIEAMTYRKAHHSTSDDSSLYRDIEEDWNPKDDPLDRFTKFMKSQGWATEEQGTMRAKEERKAVLEAIGKSEKKKKPHISTLFSDVYKHIPHHIANQEKDLAKHMARHPEEYQFLKE